MSQDHLKNNREDKSEKIIIVVISKKYIYAYIYLSIVIKKKLFEKNFKISYFLLYIIVSYNFMRFIVYRKMKIRRTSVCLRR